MNVNSITSQYGYNSESSGRVPNQEMDKDAFMQLLVTQMRYQDPLNPMDNQEMMAQLAQFTALEQMKNVASMTEKQVAHGLVGQWVEYTYQDVETGETSTLLGKVDYVKTKNGQLLIGIEEQEVTLKDIQAVIDPSEISSSTTAFDLLGKTVQVVMKEDSENVIVEGEVQQIRIKDKEPYIVIGKGEKEVEVPFIQVNNIVDKPTLTGKEIVAETFNSSGERVEITGKVEYVTMTKDETYLYVNGMIIAYEDVKSFH